MLQLNLLITFYIVLTSGVMVFSKDKKNQWRRCYLIVNLCILAWMFFTFLTPTRGSCFLKTLCDWTPLLLLPVLHRQTAILTSSFGKRAYDPSFISFEKKYFPIVMSMHYQNRMNYKFLSEFLHLCYLSFYLLLYGVPLYFYIQADLHDFYISTFAILFLLFSCYLTHAIVPVYGPRNIFEKINDHRSVGFFFQLVHKLLEKGSTDGTAFPSGHTGIASVIFLITWYLNTPLFYFILPLVIGLIVSTVYGRFHYVVDMIFGAIYAIMAFIVTRWVY